MWFRDKKTFVSAIWGTITFHPRPVPGDSGFA